MTESDLVNDLVLAYSDSLPGFDVLIQELERGRVQTLDEFADRYCRDRGIEPTPERIQLAKDALDLMADAVEGGFIDDLDRMGDLLQMHGWKTDFLDLDVTA